MSVNAILTNPTLLIWLRVLLILAITILVARLCRWLMLRFLHNRRFTRLAKEGRMKVLQSLLSGMVQLIIMIFGISLALIRLGVSSSAIVTALGLFSAAFGLSAQPILSDYLSGMILIFEDMFSVGEKVDMMERNVTGTVEAVDLRVTRIRSESGEIYLVPNGSVRVVHNLSRGQFSMATVRMKVASEDLDKTLKVLDDVTHMAKEKLSDLIQEPYVVSETGVLSRFVELTLVAKTSYGKGAQTRPELMALITQAFREADIHFAD
jgi:moderate conductance mechanosensitive channel